jgi:type IV pilus assembly protein PilY1
MERIMKTKKTLLSRKPTLLQHLGVMAITAMVSLAGVPVHAATYSFPDYPLLTGGSSIPPNILMILDDSGSMEDTLMRADGKNEDTTDLDDSVSHRSYVNNTLYYDPSINYLPWRTSSQDLSVRLAAADFKNAASSFTSTTANKIDLRDSTESYFYVPKSGVSNPGTDVDNYDKYRIGTSSASGSGASGSYSGGAVQKLATSSGPSGVLSASKNNYSTCTAIATGSGESITITISGNKNADLYVYSSSSCKSSSLLDSSTGNGSTKSVTIASPPGTVYLAIYGDKNAVSNINWSTSLVSWQNAIPTGSTGTTRTLQQDELQNFANWYQYHRSRNKMAKAGASEAFGRLGTNYRVGFDTIWNRNSSGNTINTSGSVPAYPIPYATNGGLFSGTNRDTFYSRLQGSGASNSTPLKGALQRAARYFKTDDPWKTDSTGAMLTCRQNYAILTTDGYWNSDSGYTAVGNADKSTNSDVDGNHPQYPDTYVDTLADVAYQYWSTDLKTGTSWPNNVLTSTSDPADWQHMVTFGVSIGLQGNLDQNSPPPSPWNQDPTTGGESAKRIDDLWHAALNGRGKFVVANNSDKFATALINALSTIDSRSASGSNIASSSTKTDTSTITFVAGFTSGSWSGDLIASPFNSGLTGVSTTPDWILSQTFATGQVNANFKNRTILTMKGGTATLFTAAAVNNKADFAARTGQADEATADNNIAYLRGDQSKEIGQTGGTLRKRNYPIGDIVDSSPTYIEDTKTVFIGANDGMLHAIDADSSDTTNRGKVLFSYVPKGIDYTAMASLSATAYSHRYFVDGQIDVISQADQGNDKNILVGALGRGGRGVFALDVTNPTAMTTSQVLWDNTTQDSTTEKDMGYVLGRVLIRNGNGGKTYAFVPNGIDSPNGSATLFVYELNANGGIASTTKLVADSGSGNGLMSLGMADLNGDNKVDTVYGGDLKGNVWRWDFSGNTPPATAVKLFQAKDDANTPQPITGGLGVGRDSSGNIFLGFGTGRFISSSDMPGVATQTTQTLYGIKDQVANISGRDKLQQRTIPYSGTTAEGAAARGFENYSALPLDKMGWYIDLPVPERTISAPTIYGTAMYLSTVIPATGSDCNSSVGSGFLNAIDLYTGTSPESGAYFTDPATLTDGDGGTGVLGSIGITGGMPTEVNVTSVLATVGTGAFTSEDGGEGNTTSHELGNQPGGTPARVNWRELVPSE